MQIIYTELSGMTEKKVLKKILNFVFYPHLKLPSKPPQIGNLEFLKAFFWGDFLASFLDI